MHGNFDAALQFVWGPGRDSPADGPHTTPGDDGGLTHGGVTHATWDQAVREGVVSGALTGATRDQLGAVLRHGYWGHACNALPAGLDLLLFNGRMMSGGFNKLFQQSLGCMGAFEVDGDIGPVTLALAEARDAVTVIGAISGAHHAYLMGLAGWTEFGAGWDRRVRAAYFAALVMATSRKAPMA